MPALVPTLLSLGTITPPAPPLRIIITLDEELRTNGEGVSRATFAGEHLAFKALQHRFDIIKGVDVIRESLAVAGDANSGEHALRVFCNPDELDQLNSLRRARLDHVVVNGGGVGCSKGNGDDGEDSRDVHFVLS